MGTLLASRSVLFALFFSILSAASLSLTKTRASLNADLSSLTLRVLDEAGRPLPARVRIEPSSWSERVRLGRKDLLRAVPVQGLELALRAGSYRIYVSRGPEWSIAQELLELEAGANTETTFSLVHQIALPGWQAADLHVHTTHSTDAHERGGIRALDLQVEGISLAAATDHNHVGTLNAGIDSVAGAEITTWDPEIGHFNAFPLRTLPRWRGTTPTALFAELRKIPDVFVQINHPRLEDHIAFFTLGEFDGRRFKRAGFALDAHGLEVWNGYQLASPRAVRALLGEWRSWVAAGRRLTATGGSDSHGVRGHLPGYPRTYARAARATELAPALKRGEAFVTNGPLLDLRVNGAGVGAQVAVSSDGIVKVDLTLLAPDWLQVDELEVWADERLVWSRHIPRAEPQQPLRHSDRLSLDVRGVNTLQAVAHGGRGLSTLLGRSDVEPLAFTNPVYLGHATGQQASP
jgi:hypothetical protein